MTIYFVQWHGLLDSRLWNMHGRSLFFTPISLKGCVAQLLWIAIYGSVINLSRILFYASVLSAHSTFQGYAFLKFYSLLCT